MTDYLFYNESCITGIKHIADETVDLVFTDPPYGINGDDLDKHYNREESNVIPGYIDVPNSKYFEFSDQWIKECERVLRPGGSIYIMSGYTNLHHILNVLHSTNLYEVNHLITSYTFGVYTTKKFVSSHYHLLYWSKKPEKKRVFNKVLNDTKESYNERLSVQKMKRDYKKGEKKNRNQLSLNFVKKFILLSSNEQNLVLDPFLGGFTTAFACKDLNRKCVGFEMNSQSFDYFNKKFFRMEGLFS
jgi:site-specific DNA-methyltransferase (adenine-specific)